MINFRSIDDMSQTIKKRLHEIPDVDCIVGIPRSGMLPASMIALYLNKPLMSLEDFKHGANSEYCTNRIKFSNKMIERILIVDDSVLSGHCINQIKKDIASMGYLDILYAAVYVLESSKKYVDFWFEVCEHLRLFEWNIMDHSVLSSSCVDLNGVLCTDPTLEENDDGENYLKFIKTAKPKFIPQHKIGSVVTCRLEKYRKETEEWLRQHNIKYAELYMMNYRNAEERRRDNQYSQYKANIFIETGANLFIESNAGQAEMIYLLTKKPVYCVGNNKFYGG